MAEGACFQKTRREFVNAARVFESGPPRNTSASAAQRAPPRFALQIILNQDCIVWANIMSPESLSLPWKNAV